MTALQCYVELVRSLTRVTQSVRPNSKEGGGPSHTVRTSEAAAYLNVSPNTLRAWEQRFGFPRPQRSPGRQRIYTFAELVALREALGNGLTVSSAVSIACDAVAADENTLTAALLGFNYMRADRAMELGLSLGTLESAVMQVMLPALQQVEDKTGAGSAPWAFASRWADEWLSRAKRLAFAGEAGPHVLFVDCFEGGSTMDAVRARVLELFCVRSGMAVLRLPAGACRQLERATAVFAPSALVVAGDAAPGEQAERFAHLVRCRAWPLTCLHYARADGIEGSRPLPSAPPEARDELVTHLRTRSKQAAASRGNGSRT
jgi:MerR family transcriptional regulator, light-induced transcriptional regulator